MRIEIDIDAAYPLTCLLLGLVPGFSVKRKGLGAIGAEADKSALRATVSQSIPPVYNLTLLLLCQISPFLRGILICHSCAFVATGTSEV